MPLTPKERALERLGWLSPEAMNAFGVKGAFDMCFSVDVELAWTAKYKIRKIKGVSPLGKAFVMTHGGAKAFKGMTEQQFEALPGRHDLCTEEEFAPDKSLMDDDFDIKPEDAARLHPYWAGMKVNPLHGYIDDGTYLRPVFKHHLDPKYAHLPREEDAAIDIRVGVENNIVMTLDPVTQRGAHIIDDLDGKISDGAGNTKSLIGMKFKGGFENWTWMWKGTRLQVMEL